MLCIADPGERGAFIKGLCALASYLARHPDIPVPDYGITINVHADSDQDGGFDEVDQIAALLGVPVTDNTATGGHYQATRSFGPIRYTVVSISVSYTARHLAHMFYADSVIPDDAATMRPDIQASHTEKD